LGAPRFGAFTVFAYPGCQKIITVIANPPSSNLGRERTRAPRHLQTQKNHGRSASVADMQWNSGSYRMAITEGATRRICASSFRVLFIAFAPPSVLMLPWALQLYRAAL